MILKDIIPVLGTIKDRVHQNGGTLINLYLSGSNLYNWNSEDSDIDLRGTYVLDKKEFLGLNQPKKVIQVNGIKDMDIELFELGKCVSLAVKGNCNRLEEFYAKQVYDTAAHKELKSLLHNHWGKDGVYNSYRGTAYQNYKKFILHGRNTVKKYLYVFRALMAGTYALAHGELQPDMELLAKYYRVDAVKELLRIKRAGRENEPLHTLEDGSLDVLINEWFDKIDETYNNCEIPEYMDKKHVAKLNNFVINKHLEMSNDGR
jgi:hypothetical protein